MKTLTKVILWTLLAIALGFGVHYVLREMGILMDPAGDPTQLAGDAMTTARAMFTEKPDEIQLFTSGILVNTGEEYVAGEDGKPYMLDKAGKPVRVAYPDNGTEHPLEAVFGDYECGGKVLQVLVKEDAVIFYTAFPRGGCAGFLYEKEQDTTAYYDYVELVENWKLFYRIPLE